MNHWILIECPQPWYTVNHWIIPKILVLGWYESTEMFVAPFWRFFATRPKNRLTALYWICALRRCGANVKADSPSEAVAGKWNPHPGPWKMRGCYWNLHLKICHVFHWQPWFIGEKKQSNLSWFIVLRKTRKTFFSHVEWVFFQKSVLP